MVLSRVRLIRVKLVLVNLNPINDTYRTYENLMSSVLPPIIKRFVEKTFREKKTFVIRLALH